MYRLSDEIGVALVKEACPICCKLIDGPILLGNQFNKKRAKEINNLTGQCIGYSEKPCPECQKLIDDNMFLIIAIDSEKSDDMNNPYRTGQIVGINKDSDFVKSIPEPIRKNNYCFMNYKEMITLRLLKE